MRPCACDGRVAWRWHVGAEGGEGGEGGEEGEEGEGERCNRISLVLTRRSFAPPHKTTAGQPLAGSTPAEVKQLLQGPAGSTVECVVEATGGGGRRAVQVVADLKILACSE